MRKVFSFLIFFTPLLLVAQPPEHTNEFSFGFGQSQGTFAFNTLWDWRPGDHGFKIGTGVRMTVYRGWGQYYSTAPAKLTSGSRGPQILFKKNIPENIDTFYISRPGLMSFNAMIDLAYAFSDRLTVGFNIDAIGVSFGNRLDGKYIHDGEETQEEATPTSFNLLLVSDNDKGTLNSELYARYFVNASWAVRGGMEFLFTEYTTKTNIQQFPEPNDRFRRKSLMLNVGVAFKLMW